MKSRAHATSTLSQPAGLARTTDVFPLTPIDTEKFSSWSPQKHGRGGSSGARGREVRTAASSGRKGKAPMLDSRLQTGQRPESPLRLRPGTSSLATQHVASSPKSDGKQDRAPCALTLAAHSNINSPRFAPVTMTAYSNDSPPLSPIKTISTTRTVEATAHMRESSETTVHFLEESKSNTASSCSNGSVPRPAGGTHRYDTYSPASPLRSPLRDGLGSRAASRQGQPVFDEGMLSSPKLSGAPIASRLTATTRSVRLARAELAELRKLSHKENSMILPRLRCLGRINITSKAKLGSVTLARDDLRRDATEDWCRLHNRVQGQSLSMSETRTLRKWFMQMDADGSGEVSVDELLEPLLSCGVVRSKAEIRQIFINAGLDSTGEVGFNDLMKALNKVSDVRMKSKIVGLQEMCNDDTMETDTLLSSERRRLLLKSTIEDTTRRNEAVERVLASSDRVDSDELQAIMKTFTRLVNEQELSMREHIDFIQTLQVALGDQLRDLHKYQKENKEEHRAGLSTTYQYGRTANGSDSGPDDDDIN